VHSHERLLVLGHRLVDVPEIQDVESAIPVLDDGLMVAQLNAPRPSSCVVHIALGEGEVMDHEAVRQLLVHQASEQPAGGALTRVPSSLG
jgi:hypothetical protein